MCGEGVAQRMWMNCFRDPGEACSVAAGEENSFWRDGLSRIGAGEQPAGGPLGSPVAAQQVAQFRRQQRLAILASFPAANPEHVASAVDIGDLEARDFAHAETGCIHDREHGAMPEIARRLEQRLHFSAAQNQRQLPFAAWKRNAIDGDLAMERVSVEETKSADHLHESRLRHLLFFDEEDLIPADMLSVELIGRHAEMPSKLGDGVQINPDGGWREVAELKILQHPLS